jgi:hypothetical protein
MVSSGLATKIDVTEDEPFWWATSRSLELYAESPEELSDIQRAIELEREGFQVAGIGAGKETISVIVPGIGILCQADISAHISKRRVRQTNFYRQLGKAWEYAALTNRYET